MALIAVAAMITTACAFPRPYEADPTTVYQWERRQEDIQRREGERVRLCGIMNKDSDRYKRDCSRPGDPN